MHVHNKFDRSNELLSVIWLGLITERAEVEARRKITQDVRIYLEEREREEGEKDAIRAKSLEKTNRSYL